MTGITKSNPAATTTNVETVGKDITFFTVDYINAVNGSAGPTGVQKAVIDLIQTRAVLVAVGPLFDSDTQQTFGVEGTFPLNIYPANDGTANLSFTAALQDDIRNLGTFDGVTVSSATVTAKDLAILT